MRRIGIFDEYCSNSVNYSATFRELGPPDLCHVVKSTGRSGQRDVCCPIFNTKTSFISCRSLARIIIFPASMPPPQHPLRLTSIHLHTPSKTTLPGSAKGVPGKSKTVVTGARREHLLWSLVYSNPI